MIFKELRMMIYSTILIKISTPPKKKAKNKKNKGSNYVIIETR